MKGTTTMVFYAALATVLLSVAGCSSIAFLAEGDAALIGRSSVGLEMTEGGIALTGESEFTEAINKALSISQKMGRVTFTLSLEGVSAEYELVAPDMVRRVGSTDFIRLTGRLAQIKAKIKIPFKSGPGANEKTDRWLNPGRPLLVLGDSVSGGWCKVRIEEHSDGWVEQKYVQELYKTPEQILDEYSKNRNNREAPVSDCSSKKGNIVILMQSNKQMHYNDPHSALNTFVIRLPKFKGATANEDFYYTSFTTDNPVTLYNIPEDVYTYEVKVFGGAGSYQGWHPNNTTKAAGTINVVGCKDVQLALTK